ncbi:MAG: hypothetical protein KJ971_04295 [Firmicutes bacterium]|nr:hypothetical protein [Bacillota bacterium]
MSQKAKLAGRIIYASKATRIAKASRLGIVVSAVLTFLIFAISYYGEVVGNFSFSVDRLALDAGITMYDDPEVPDFVTRIIANKVDEADGMTAYCGTEYTEFSIGDSVCIPSDEELGSVNGPNNGENYLVQTFYVQNAGQYAVDLAATISLLSVTKGADEAVRVRVIFNGVGTTYARVQSASGDNPGMLEPLTDPFVGATTVMNQEFIEFQPEQTLKVTVILWYEGEDSNHNINLHSGGVKFEMKFTISRIYNPNL